MSAESVFIEVLAGKKNTRVCVQTKSGNGVCGVVQPEVGPSTVTLEVVYAASRDVHTYVIDIASIEHVSWKQVTP